jgi:hypothetical protein
VPNFLQCDETLPICARCQRNGRFCSYSLSEGLLGPGGVAVNTGSSGISILSDVTLLPFASPNGSNNGTPTISLLRHFFTHWSEIFHIPPDKGVISLSQINPLIRSTVLAISASHLRHISPGVLQHRIAEHFQQTVALKDFQAVLGTPVEQLDQAAADAILMSATLLNIIAFALPESENMDKIEPKTSWVFSPRKDRLSWLALQAGFRPLLLTLSPYLDNTICYLAPIFFAASERQSWEFSRMDRGLEGIPELWIKVFELTTNDSGSGNGFEGTGSASAIFRPAVTILAHLQHIEPLQGNVFRNLQFLIKAHPEFRALLYDRDPRALWVFGFFLGVLLRYKHVWWCEKRATRDYRAIYMWLQKLHLNRRPGVEGEQWATMMEQLKMAPIYNPSRG